MTNYFELAISIEEIRENIFSDNIDDIISSNIVGFKTEREKQSYINKKGKTKTKNVKVRTAKEGEIFYYHKNHLGSIIKISDKSGDVVEEYEYDVFGRAYIENKDKRLKIKEGEDEDSEGTELKTKGKVYKKYNGKGVIDNARLYTGREYDKEIDLYYFRARYYSVDMGRFINRDPIDIVDDVNLYAYVGNNSLKYVDLMGREKSILVIGTKGYPGPTDNSPIELSGIYQILNKLNNLDGYETKFYSSTFNQKAEIESIINEVEKMKHKELVLIGHSWGADSMVQISNKLNEKNIKVDLMITIDICGGYKCLDSNNYVSNNVKSSVNYYQDFDFTTETNPLFRIPYFDIGIYNLNIEKRLVNKDFKIENVENILIENTDHISIDNDLTDKVYKIITERYEKQ